MGYQHNYMADKLLNAIAEALKQYDNNSINNDEYYWYLAWKGLYDTRPWRQHWPYYPVTPITGAPYTTNDSTRGLKYALTPTRIDSLHKSITHEWRADASSKGRKPVSNGCY